MPGAMAGCCQHWLDSLPKFRLATFSPMELYTVHLLLSGCAGKYRQTGWSRRAGTGPTTDWSEAERPKAGVWVGVWVSTGVAVRVGEGLGVGRPPVMKAAPLMRSVNTP